MKVGCIRVTHPCATGPRRAPFDLHVLGLPLAFILSQDQTLHCSRLLTWSQFQKIKTVDVVKTIDRRYAALPCFVSLLSGHPLGASLLFSYLPIHSKNLPPACRRCLRTTAGPVSLPSGRGCKGKEQIFVSKPLGNFFSLFFPSSALLAKAWCLCSFPKRVQR